MLTNGDNHEKHDLSPKLVELMKLPRDEHHGNHVERAIAVIATRMNRLVSVTKSTGVAQAWRETHIALARAQEFAAGQFLHDKHHAPAHD